MRGSLEYAHQKHHDRQHKYRVEKMPTRAPTKDLFDQDVLSRGRWFSEPVLWVQWQHTGRVSVRDNAIVCRVDATKFQDGAERLSDFKWVCTMYARVFANMICLGSPSDLSGPSDKELVREEFDNQAARVTELHSTGESKLHDLPWEANLPSHILSRVCAACVTMARRIAIDGLDENRPHHGFTVIIGNAESLENCGRSGFNPFASYICSIVDGDGMMNEDVFEIMRRNAFHGDGAIVIDGLSGTIVASGWFVSDISKGGTQGGARTQSAKAIAQQAGGCYVIKCSEDSSGMLVLHLGVFNVTDSQTHSTMELKTMKFNGDLRMGTNHFRSQSSSYSQHSHHSEKTFGTEVKKLLERRRLLPWAELVTKILERDKMVRRESSASEHRMSKNASGLREWEFGTLAI